MVGSPSPSLMPDRVLGRQRYRRLLNAVLPVALCTGASALAAGLHWLIEVDRRIPLGGFAGWVMLVGSVLVGSAIRLIWPVNVRLAVAVVACILGSIASMPVIRFEVWMRETACWRGDGYACYEAAFVRNRILRRQLWRGSSEARVSELLARGCRFRVRAACERLMISEY